MKPYLRQERIWKTLCFLFHPLLKRKMHVEAEPLPDISPVFLICNHVTNLDPLLLSLSSPRRLLIYVASENILRNSPLLRRLLYWALSPISRRKGASAVDTCRKIVRTLRSGKSVCLFAEGETTWNGKTGPVKPGTDVLVRASGAPLVTYCFEGGYCTSPRWSRGLRCGKMRGHVTGIYSADQIRAMSDETLRSVIDSGIREDAFLRQHQEHVAYHGKHMMDQAEVLLFLCPQCHRTGTLRGSNRQVSCPCGFSVTFDECMLPSDPSPFPDLCAWDEWQTSAFAEMIAENKVREIHDDQEKLLLFEIQPDNTMHLASQGGISMNRHEMVIGSMHFSLSEVTDIALLQNRKAAFSCQDRYYELQSPSPLCLRKYRLLWQCVTHPADQT